MAEATEQQFPGDPQSPGAARHFVTDTVGRLLTRPVSRAFCDDLELVVSELVTNAVRAGSSVVIVAVALERGRVVLHVTDDAGGWPEPREAGVHDIGGRGLPLVSAVSAAWGVRLSGAGKMVWAELPVPPDE